MRKEQIVAPLAPLTLFYSYAHEDEELRDQLEKHLRQLQRQGLISAWHDREILPGGAWAHEIDKHLEMASLILLLVSSDFLASDYCYDNEMEHALERHRRDEARVVPIILRPCDWQHSPLKDLQCLPRDGKPVTQWPDQDEVFNTITQSLRRIIEQQQSLANSPMLLSPINQQNRIRLLKQVRATWIDGLLTHSLHQVAQIELRLQDRPDVLANPWQLQVQELHQAPQTLPDGTTIVQVYDKADSELLILGEPGAGKTTLLLELARILLERAEQDEQLRMPIIFNLSSWAEKRQPLNVWLVEELAAKYQVPRKIGQNWVDADKILPLLDGLDEVAKDACSACVEQINAYYQSRLEHGSSPLVICCRSEEYNELSNLSAPIKLQHAVSILPLTDEQINTYLEHVGEQVQGLRQALNLDTELHSLARQPLMLTIFTFAYQGATAAEIPTSETHEEIQHTIFATYVERMLKRRGQSKRWQSKQMVNSLAFLAQQMQQHNQTVFSVESLQPDWLSRKWRTLCRLSVGVPSALISGLFISLPVGLASGLHVGLLVGLLVGLFTGINIVDTSINPIEALTWSWKEARFKLMTALTMGLIFGLTTGLLIGLFDNPFTGLFVGLIIWIFISLLSGLIILGQSGRRLPERLSFSPNESTWRAGKNGLILWLVIGLIGGLLMWPFTGLLLGLTFGLAIVLLLGRSAGLDIFMKHFTLRFFLSQQGNLPWDLVPFLDEAAERLLLRKVGGSYIFIHRLLLEYFAELKSV